nr:MAG TPA: hypothetical protein [Caudoviricetes sp.]
MEIIFRFYIHQKRRSSPLNIRDGRPFYMSIRKGGT